MSDDLLKPSEPPPVSKREFLKALARGACLLAGGGAIASLASGSDARNMVWQIDPAKCTACGKCATACVLNPSAVKCVHEQEICGYCELCFGYFVDQRAGDEETAENRRCPTDAILRRFVEDPYHQYIIDEAKCIGCGLCVEGCRAFGNGALILQVRHDRCINCNQCAIATVCPAEAFVRVPASDPYLLRAGGQGGHGNATD